MNKREKQVITFLMVILVGLNGGMLFAADGGKIRVSEPELIDETVNLFDAGDIFLSGQPEKATLDKLASEGITTVINIRTEEEMAIHDSQSYNEKEYVEGLNMSYIQVPVGGDAGFTAEAVAAIARGIDESEGKVLLHCRRAGRATLVWMAWLVNYRNISVNKAFDLGKSAQFSFPLEDLLGYELKMKAPKRRK